MEYTESFEISEEEKKYLLNLAPDFSVLDLAESFLYEDSQKNFRETARCLIKSNEKIYPDQLLYFYENTTNSGDLIARIPFRRGLLKIESVSESDPIIENGKFFIIKKEFPSADIEASGIPKVYIGIFQAKETVNREFGQTEPFVDVKLQGNTEKSLYIVGVAF